jgi:hypothetical protein
MGQRDRGLGENTLRWGKPVGEADTPVLGELISPKRERIPWRNQEITTKGSWVASTVRLERRKVKSEEIGEGVSSVQGVKTRENWIVRFLKPDSPVFPGQPKSAFDNLSLFQVYACRFKGLKTME